MEAGEWYFDVDMYNIRLLNESPDAIHDPILLFEMNVYVYEMIEKADFYFNPSTQEIKKISEQNGVTVYRPGDEDYDFLRSCVKQNQYAYVRLVDPRDETLHNGDWYFDWEAIRADGPVGSEYLSSADTFYYCPENDYIYYQDSYYNDPFFSFFILKPDDTSSHDQYSYDLYRPYVKQYIIESAVCNYCGEIHDTTTKLGWFISLFHDIVYFFKSLFLFD